MRHRFKSGGIAAWSIYHPVGISMLALSILVLGLFALKDLGIDLLPHIIYPEVRVRVLDPGVPAKAMEDRITRQLEEQLAITEDAISIQSSSREGRSAVDLSFPYGTDINLALRDASTRLDRAKRFLPNSIDPPIIYKRDPSQFPALEFVISSEQLTATQLREWSDYQLSKWFINLSGVAAIEVAGAAEREIKLIIDQERLASLNLDFNNLIDSFKISNSDTPGGEFQSINRNINTRVSGRFTNIKDIAELPLFINSSNDSQLENIIRLRDIGKITDSQADEKVRIRLNSIAGVKLSIQKQPTANTTEVVDAVLQQLNFLKQQNIVPENINIDIVSDQSIFIRHALRNASYATLSGALLAMLVIYVFLGSLRRTLIVGTAIPLAILITLILMSAGDLTLNIMTVGGLALGVGMLVDNTIVMQENIARHQLKDSNHRDAALNATIEVNSAIIASTSTNLAAVLPFLFIGGIVGLLFSELILTLSAAILSSLIIALTLVPALSAQIDAVKYSRAREFSDQILLKIQQKYTKIINTLISKSVLVITFFIFMLLLTIIGFSIFSDQKEVFLPQMDEGKIGIYISGDPGMQLDDMDHAVKKIEHIISKQTAVSSIFTSAGGFVFGRSVFERSNRSHITVQLIERHKRTISIGDWVKKTNQAIKNLKLVGFRIRIRVRGIRGIRTSRGNDDISIRVQGSDISTLTQLGDDIVQTLQSVKEITNISHTYEEQNEELVVHINRQRAAELNINIADIGTALRIAMRGIIISEFLDGDRQYDIRIRLAENLFRSPAELENLLVGHYQGQAIRLRDIGKIKLELSPAEIIRDQQHRNVEISASLKPSASMNKALKHIDQALQNFKLPDGYVLYDGGTKKLLQEGKNLGFLLLFLAIFLVFVVMAVQYESLRNPIIILIAIPFTLIGVILGILLANVFINMPMSMPVKLGIIMLTGIVVNNAILLVEQIENLRDSGIQLVTATVDAANQRLRPILMTVLTTVLGMSPLALGIGDGAEMLQPMAIVIISGLCFSVFVSLLLIPIIYITIHKFRKPVLN